MPLDGNKLRPVLRPALAAVLAVLAAGPAMADVKDGVDAWSRGDYAAAVREWEGPAAEGDPDAMFNLGQAYRLGRGVPEDKARAETLYAKAAALGHVRAADTYGLMLFQDGRQEMALPYVQASAARGDPRAQYLLGIAHFNGDIVPRDWVRAYALLTLSNAAGLPQAGPALSQMNQFIPLEQRQQGASLAVQLRNEADATRARDLAAADLENAPALASADPDAPSAPAAVPQASESSQVPRPIPTTAVSPSVAAARGAIDQARSATGTSSPAEAGASYARGSAPAPAPAPAAPAPARPEPTRVARSEPAPTAPQPAASGPWAVQLGAFSVSGNAERLWSKLSTRSELAGRERLLVPSGRVTILLAGGYPSQASANAACRSLKSSGQDCLVKRR